MATILIVEDNINILDNLTETLAFHDYQIIKARNGIDGLHQARTHKPDMIISDIIMPEMDGYQMVQMLREDPTTADIPVVFTTARADEDSVREGVALGAAYYIVKPYYSSDLIEMIDKVLNEQ